MPSAYTYKIVEGEQSFQEFLWSAVRAMGVFVHMREDSSDAQLRFPEPPFYTKGSHEKIEKRRASLSESEQELRDEKTKTPEQVEAEYEAHKIRQLDEYEKTYAKNKPINDRITRLRSEVADWQSPSEEHEGFKKFMLRQLDETTEWDTELPKLPVFKETATEWHAKNIGWLETYVERCKELLQEETDSPDVGKTHVEWIMDLICSVPPPPGRFEQCP